VIENNIAVHDLENEELPLAWAGGLNAAHYNTMDLNGDGNEDLVTFDRTAGRITTFLNEGSAYVYHPEYETYFPEGITNWVLLRDYNCDGKKDLFTGDILGIKVYANKTTPGSPPVWEQFLFYSGFPGPKSPVLLTKGFSGKINLQLQFDDLPAVVDADGDGDLDIFSVRFVGNGSIEYHRNYSMERYGTCDSLDFERETQSWGDLTECGCGSFAFNGANCPPSTGGRVQHAGGKSLLVLDVEGDGDVDVLLSEASCAQLYLLRNDGTLEDPIINTSSSFPSSNRVNFSIFPAAFYEDLDFDGTKDLVAIPNVYSRTTLSLDFEQSNWFYANGGTDQAPDFTLQTKAFLQDRMIDVGDNAVPAFIDYDADGDYDLFVSQHTSAQFVSSIALYENTGTNTAPAFRLADEDVWEFSFSSFYNLKIQFADINSDSKIDLVFTATAFNTGLTSLFYLPNKGTTSIDFGNQTIQGTGFNLGFSENITVTDIDKDGLPDLLVGTASGALAYWRNNGPPGTFNFTLEDDAYLGLSSTVLRQNIACTTADLDGDGRVDLLYGDQTGRLNIVSNFREAVDASSASREIVFDPFSSTYISRNFGGRVWPSAVNLFGTTRPALVIGNVTGGLSVLRHDDGESLPVEPVISVYPNPLPHGTAVNIVVDRQSFLQVFSTVGQEITTPIYLTANEEYPYRLPDVAVGVYILRFTIGERVFSRRIVIY
jgi:hypothetical protein